MLADCSNGPTDVAGTSSGGEGRTVAIVVRDVNDSLAAGVQVSLYRVFDDSGMYYPKIDSGLTDAAGAVTFRKVSPDSYFVAASTVDSTRMSFIRRLSFDTTAQDTVRASQTLKPSGTVSGAVDIATSERLSVRIAGTPFTVDCAPGSGFSFRLPADSFFVQSVVRGPADTPSCVAAESPVTILPSVNTPIDSLRLDRPFSGPGTLALDDFEDSNFVSNLGLWWWTFDDSATGGTSHVASRIGVGNVPDTPGASGTSYALRMGFTFGTNYPMFVGLGFFTRANADGTRGSVDLSGATALTFYAKGSGMPFSVSLVSGIVKAPISIDIPAADTAWTLHRIDLTALAAQYDTTAVPLSERLRFVTQVLFQVAGRSFGESGELWVDEVKLEY
jgi:hypothetical protein